MVPLRGGACGRFQCNRARWSRPRRRGAAAWVGVVAHFEAGARLRCDQVAAGGQKVRGVWPSRLGGLGQRCTRHMSRWCQRDGGTSVSVAKSPLAKMAQRGLEVFMAVYEISDSTRQILLPPIAGGKENRWCYEVTQSVALQRIARVRGLFHAIFVWTSIRPRTRGVVRRDPRSHAAHSVLQVRGYLRRKVEVTAPPQHRRDGSLSRRR